MIVQSRSFSMCSINRTLDNIYSIEIFEKGMRGQGNFTTFNCRSICLISFSNSPASSCLPTDTMTDETLPAWERPKYHARSLWLQRSNLWPQYMARRLGVFFSFLPVYLATTSFPSIPNTSTPLWRLRRSQQNRCLSVQSMQSSVSAFWAIKHCCIRYLYDG